MNGVHKWAVAFVVVLFGVGTTAALQVVAKPYVCRMLLDSSGELMRLETMSFLGRSKFHRVELKDISATDKPWATFTSIKDPKTLFFVEESPDSYVDQKFRQRLFEKIGKVKAGA